MKDQRLYIELLPTDESRKIIDSLVGKLRSQIDGKYISPTKWHVTIIHFGKADNVYQEILKVNGSLSETEFQHAFEIYTDKSNGVLQHNIELKSSGLSLFGANESVLALTFEISNDIRQAHQQGLAYLKQFFASCGIDDITGFMKASHNFQYALGIKPHLAIARDVAARELPGVQDQNFKFLPADIAGI